MELKEVVGMDPARAAIPSRTMDEKVIVELLGQVGSLFTASLDLKENIDFMLKAASDLVACDAATVFLVEEDEAVLSAIATFPFGESVGTVSRFKMGEGIVGWAAQKRRVVSVADATKDRRFKSLPLEYAPRSFLVMPLESPRRLVGALTVARKQVQPFTGVEQALIQVIANQAAISVENARLYHAQRDQLAEIASQKRDLEMANVQVEEASRLKSEFLANMSHELRTPLNAILGFSEILKDNLAGNLSPQQVGECLESIHASGKHLLELVNDVLDLSKIEAGRMELAYENFPVAGALREVNNVIKSLSERRELDLTERVEPPDVVLMADKSKFKQVMYNLLSNAIKFTPPGGKIWVQASKQAGELVVEVGDTGIGISPEHQDLVFNEFYQVAGRRNRQTQGTGLGLSLTRRIVELHGGTISLESAEGKGSIFTVRLPIAGIVPEDDGRSQRNHILLVEDNPSNRELTKLVLSGNGFEVDIAIDGHEGLQKARDRKYDLILMDVQLPGLDGLTVTRMLKGDPSTASTPIVALTANAMRGDEQKAMAAGCSGYITKPIEVARFVQQIADYLGEEK